MPPMRGSFAARPLMLGWSSPASRLPSSNTGGSARGVPSSVTILVAVALGRSRGSFAARPRVAADTIEAAGAGSGSVTAWAAVGDGSGTGWSGGGTGAAGEGWLCAWGICFASDSTALDASFGSTWFALGLTSWTPSVLAASEDSGSPIVSADSACRRATLEPCEPDRRRPDREPWSPLSLVPAVFSELCSTRASFVSASASISMVSSACCPRGLSDRLPPRPRRPRRRECLLLSLRSSWC